MNIQRYESKIEGYRFKLVHDGMIAVFDDDDEDSYPCSIIRLREGDIRDEKDFHYEIMDWFSKNII